jgi:hypothetical protein
METQQKQFILAVFSIGLGRDDESLSIIKCETSIRCLVLFSVHGKLSKMIYHNIIL